MFNLLPWRWSHWVLLLVGPLFVVTYFSLLSWGPVDEAIQRLASQPGPRDAPGSSRLLTAEAILGLVSLLLLTPLVGMVVLFLLLFAMVIVGITLAPLVRRLGLPDWAVVLLAGATFSGVLYRQSEVWLPWSLWCLDHLATAYLVPFL